MDGADLLRTGKNQLRVWRNSLKAAAHWKKLNFNDVTPIYANAFHKSGSHLLLQILYGLMDIAPYRHLEQAPIRMITAEGRKRTTQEVMRDLSKLHPGIIQWGYLSYNPEFVNFFAQRSQIATLFIYRDPRDQLISSIFYAVDIHKKHAQHKYFSSITMDERIKTAIIGRNVPGLEFLPNIRAQYENILGWVADPKVLSFKFEDLINSPSSQLERLLDHLQSKGLQIQASRETAIQTLLMAIQPENSPTFRKGKTGGWREHFTDEHIKIFKEITGDLLITLGYETDNDW